MAKQNKKDLVTRDSQYYSSLIIYRGRQFSLAMTITVFVIIFSSLIFADVINGKHWMAIGLPLVVLGLLLLLIPPTEEWQYKAWQTKTEQIERHFLD